MNSQLALGLPVVVTPSDTVVINGRCSLRTEGDQRVVVVGGLPVYHYCAGDAVAEGYAMVMLVDAGFGQQNEVARAFGRSERTVRRQQERYAEAGTAGLGRPQGWRRGRRRISGKRLRLIKRLKSQGLSNLAIAQRLGVNEKAIRKLVGPSRGEGLEQLPLAWPSKGADFENRPVQLPPPRDELASRILPLKKGGKGFDKQILRAHDDPMAGRGHVDHRPVSAKRNLFKSRGTLRL